MQRYYEIVFIYVFINSENLMRFITVRLENVQYKNNVKIITKKRDDYSQLIEGGGGEVKALLIFMRHEQN